MPELPFAYHPAAVEEAREAYRWYAEQSLEVVNRFWDELVRTRQLVSARPQGWTPYYVGTRIFQFRKFPYGLVYIERDGKLIGLAVCHLHRRPGYWKQRM